MIDGIRTYDREPLLVPATDALVARALEWARGDVEVVRGRTQFYSADGSEMPLTPVHGAALPALVAQVQNLADRTTAMEATTARAANRTSALRKRQLDYDWITCALSGGGPVAATLLGRQQLLSTQRSP